MAYTITRADSFSIAYDVALRDGMPVARTRLKTYTRPGINGYGVVITGRGGKKFSLTIEAYCTTYALAVAWATNVGLLPEGLCTIVTPRGTWTGCTITRVSEPMIRAGTPYAVARLTLWGVVP